MIRLPLMFQNHMVIQRDKTVVIWGNAEKGKKITVGLQEKKKTTITDEKGTWKLEMGPFQTSFCEEMVISSDDETICLTDVQIGDVWFAGGQSNMEFCMRYDADFDIEKKLPADDGLRFFDYPKVSYVGQIEEADYTQNYGFWRKAEEEQLERFSAVAYYFAKEIRKTQSVPVGIIGCNWGGTPACAWMSKEAILEGNGAIYLKEYEEVIQNLDLDKYEAYYQNHPSLRIVDQLNDPFSDLLLKGGTMEDFFRMLAEQGVDLTSINPEEVIQPMGPKSEKRPCGLYESMLKQIVPYSIKGILWYQGESDGDAHPDVYQTLFPALIRDWRKLWNEQLPFLFVQIAPLEQWMQCIGKNYIEIREAQQAAADHVAATGMAVTGDVGMRYDIHPKNKKLVGQRLALLAENMVYQKKERMCEAPRLKDIEVQEGKMILIFEHAGEELYLADTNPYGEQLDPNRINGLEIIQNGINLDCSKMEATAQNNRVFIKDKEIHSNLRTEVRIGKTDWFCMNLYNSAHIPAAPMQIIKQ